MNTNTMTDVSNTDLEQLEGGIQWCHTLFVAGGALAGAAGGGVIGAAAGAVWGDLWSEAFCD